MLYYQLQLLFSLKNQLLHHILLDMQVKRKAKKVNLQEPAPTGSL